MSIETLETVGRLVTQIGFPIVACGALFWFINKTLDKFQTALTTMKETLLGVSKTVEDLKDFLLPQTKVNQELIKRLEKLEG